MGKIALVIILTNLSLNSYAATEFTCRGSGGLTATFSLSEESTYSYLTLPECTGGYYGETQDCVPGKITQEWEEKQVELVADINGRNYTERFSVSRVDRKGHFLGGTIYENKPVQFLIRKYDVLDLDKYILDVRDSVQEPKFKQLVCYKKN